MPIRHATLNQLRIFDALARNMSFTRAADELHLTTPAVSIQVKQLAESARQPLYEQIGRKIYLTPAGHVMAEACRDLFNRIERLSQDLASMEGLAKGSLRLAILTTAKYFIPHLLGEFCGRHPGIEASLFVGNREALLERLARNMDDLYILGHPPANMNLEAEDFADNPLVMVARPGHLLANEAGIAPQRLDGLPFIMREPGSGIRLATEEYFAAHGVRPKVRMELGSNEAIKQAVIAGLGLAVLSQVSVKAELARGEMALLDVHGFPLMSRWYIAYPSGKHLSAAALAFKNMLAATMASEAGSAVAK